MIKITQNISEANLITHGGSFHADEVMATVILSKIFKDVTVCRTSKVTGKLRSDVVVYDIGCGKFDHHQKNGNGCRTNGVPYASAGLIWKAFGPTLVKEFENGYIIWRTIDRNIIQGIDAIDNGVMPKADYPAYSMSFSQCIFSFNPTWDSEQTTDEAFLKAVAFAETIFDNIFETAVAKAKAKSVIEEAISKSKDGIMFLDSSIPWKEYIFTSCDEKAKEILFVVNPSKRGGFTWRCVSAGLRENTFRKSVPKEWMGLRDEELRKVTGIKTATFCHSAGFIGGAETLEDTVAMVKLAIKS